MDSMNEVEKLLKMIADMQDFFDPEDELSSIISELGGRSEGELSDDELDLVIAAAKDPRTASNNRNRKKET